MELCNYCVQEADFTCTKKSRYHRCLTDIIKNPSCPDKLREEAKSFRDSTLKSRCKGGWDTINPDKLVTDDYDEDKNMDSCKEARTLCLKEANTTISCEKLKERHKCALGYKDTPYCSEGVRKDAEEWIEKHAIEDCAANDASLSEPCVEVPPSCQNNETNNATECEFYQPIVNCEMNRLTKIWCDKEKWFADVAKAISNDEAAEKSNCYGELPDHPNIALKLLQVNPVDSNSLAFGLSTVFLTYQVDLNALDKETGCYHLYFDYCKASWTDCYKFESWLTACVFPSDCHMLTCSKDEAVVTDATNVMCNCINLANQMKAILSIPTATYDAIDYKFRLRVSSSKDPGEKEAVVEISEIFKMSYYIDENFAKLPFLSKNVGAKTKLGLCGILQISALVAFTLATTFNW
ncbi:uncharacterized protein LOC131928506 [Physella acuta]|uniref:uncharacterized protein LOC131928506 n=1 Tax=Physella acuta TaxID=109671 RepID=UPI0027DE8B0B|nr:uncharacterized protein LOC131928506 [Physella acuta]